MECDKPSQRGRSRQSQISLTYETDLRMKDALGHGSETRGGTHASKIDQIGKPVLSPKVVQGILSTPPGEGFTMRLKDGAAPPQGYQVAIPGHAFPGGSGPTNEAALQAWATEHAAALKQAGHIGGYNN